ncbi:hypothetical protein J0H58_36715 [bacterium]|nr:hypothetical protein [bacterium]
MRASRPWLACGLAVVVLAPWLPGLGTRHEPDDRELERDRAAIARVWEAKGRIMTDLCAGRITLAAATDAYYEMVVACQPLLTGLRFSVPHAGSDLERAAIRLSDLTVREVPPADRPALAARLDAELRERFPGTASPPLVAVTGGQ